METCRRITQHVMQYLCAHCSTVLKETDTPLDDKLVNSAAEDCPGCGCSLLQHIVVVKRQEKPRPVIAGFQTACDTAPSRLSFDISAIDRLIDLSEKGSLCVISRDGWHANSLLTRACVRALMSKRQGGFDSPTVVFIDAGNCSDIYECVDFARQYGLDSDNILDRIIVSRPFTIHQLARLLVYELKSVMQRFAAKVIVISDLLQMFIQDPQLDPDEARWLLNEVASMIRKFSARALVIVSMRHDLPAYAGILESFFDCRIEIDSGMQIEVSDCRYDSSWTLTLPERELLVVPAR